MRIDAYLSKKGRRLHDNVIASGSWLKTIIPEVVGRYMYIEFATQSVFELDWTRISVELYIE
jgi:hypothetical protein